MGNKVEFGLSNLYFGKFSVGETGTVALEKPVHVPGAVSLKVEEKSELSNFYADNVAYYSNYTGGNLEGEIEVAKFSEEFKTTFLGYKALADGGIALVKNVTKPNIYIIFEVKGDAEARRIIMYNGTLGAINREYKTTEDTNEPTTETISVTMLGDAATGITMVSYKPADTAYSTLFTAPPVPKLTETSEM